MRTRTWMTAGGVALGALGLLARRALLLVRVEGSSMLPTYADGDRLLARRPPLTRAVRAGDVVVVVAPTPNAATDDAPTGAAETLVKRVSLVEPGRVFVAGDNPPSYDSEAFGPLPPTAVLGRVIGVVSTR